MKRLRHLRTKFATCAVRVRRRRSAQRPQKPARTFIGVPCVEVIQKASWFRIFVNGSYIDGQENSETAETIAGRLRKAFQMPNKGVP